MPDEPAPNNGLRQDSLEAGKQIMEPISEEVSSSGPSGRNVDLSLQIPPRPVVFGSSRSGKGLLQSQGSFKGNSTPGRILHSLSFKNKAVTVDGEGSSLLTPDTKEVPASPVIASIISSWNRCVSLPVTPASMFSPSITAPTGNMCGEQQTPQKKAAPPKVSRSLSVPMRNVVIVRSGSFAIRKEPVQTDTGNEEDQINHVDFEADDEEIAEEEAVCRICLISLCEGGNTFKMECSCKGDLMLTHEECVVKWFSIKGNKNCDVCGQEVRNLPVTVLRVQGSTQRDYRRGQNRQNIPQPLSVWHDLVVLILISSISYFFILEQLLIPDMKSEAIVLAAPFAFTLGLLGSMFAIVLAIKEYIWTYAALEFALVALNLHLFYAVLHIGAVYSILLSAVLGFGITISINSLYLYIYAYRTRAAQASMDTNLV